MVASLFQILKYDIVEGILHKWKFYVAAIILFILIDFELLNNINLYYDFNNQQAKGSILTYYLNLFIGSEPFEPGIGKGITIPLSWLSFYALNFFIVGNYIKNDLKNNSVNFLLRIQSRVLWWTSKFIWCVISTFVYCFLFFLVSFIYSIIFGSLSFELNSMAAVDLFDIYVSNLSIFDIILALLILPSMISISFAVFDAMLSLTIKLLFSYVLLICYIVSAAFYNTPSLLFNFSMIRRTQFVGLNDITNFSIIFICIVIMIISYIIGVFIIKRKDIR